MAKYPISHNGSKPLSDFFYEIMTFHVPPGKDRVILDPTCGKGYLWQAFLKMGLSGESVLHKNYGQVIFSDKVDYGQMIVSDIKDLKFDHELDAIVYDPPYFFFSGAPTSGVLDSDMSSIRGQRAVESSSLDPRARDYGDYVQSFEDLIWFMDIANNKFPDWLKKTGKLILKCADQYSVKKRMFYALHIDWVERLKAFNLIDFYVYVHHRMSPTAFQVKDRPCAVIMHTYFMIFDKQVKI